MQALKCTVFKIRGDPFCDEINFDSENKVKRPALGNALSLNNVLSGIYRTIASYRLVGPLSDSVSINLDFYSLGCNLGSN